MGKFILFCDAGSDLAPVQLAAWDVRCIDFTYSFVGEKAEHGPFDLPAAAFYGRIRKGETARTSAANGEAYRAAFEAALSHGSDVLYVGFSSGLSGSVNTAACVARELLSRYPARQVEVLDTKCASGGLGVLVWEAVRLRDEGKSAWETAEALRDMAPRMAHWFTVEDLACLRRGGRLSAVKALAANILFIRPILHMDGQGHLVSVSVVRGRKAALRALAEKPAALADDPAQGRMYISHADCPEDAALLDDLLLQKYGRRAEFISSIGPVIGAHCGPGTVAVFFLGRR